MPIIEIIQSYKGVEFVLNPKDNTFPYRVEVDGLNYLGKNLDDVIEIIEEGKAKSTTNKDESSFKSSLLEFVKSFVFDFECDYLLRGEIVDDPHYGYLVNYESAKDLLLKIGQYEERK